MTTAEMIAFAKLTAAEKIARQRRGMWQNSNGTWSHEHDAQREWADEIGCATDLRFTKEHYRGRA